METRSIHRGSVWQFVSPQYRHNHEEWDEDLDNDEVEQMLAQYAETILQIEDLEEHVFVNKVVHQIKGEHRAKHNTLPIMVVDTEIR